jgi:transposase
MANPHPEELRARAVNTYEAGQGSFDEIAARFGIGRRTLQRWVKRKIETGSVEPDLKGGGNPSPIDVAILRRVLSAYPDAVTGELTAAYNKAVGREHRVHRSSVLRALHRLGFVFKKNGHGQPNKIDRKSKRSGAGS